jgi:hypothetical protein
MAPGARWGLALAGIVAAGLLSRTVHTGHPLADKYPGDALYAAMVYAGLRAAGLRRGTAWWAAGGTMLAIECFQLTGIPAGMVQAGSPAAVRAAGRLLGTTFGWGDLAAYAVGIGAIHFGSR